MRTFVDAEGRQWDVAVSAASYGVQQLIFAARVGRDLRVCGISLESRIEAERMLSDLGEFELRQLLARASPWPPV